MIRRALVTGGAGFIGSRVVERLLMRGAQVHVIDDFSRGKHELLPVDERVTVTSGSITEEHVVMSVATDFVPDCVFHLAAKHYIPECEADPQGTQVTNVDGTRIVAGATRACGAGVMLFVSSAAVYAPSPLPHVEKEILGPIDVYGRSKAAAEALLMASLPAKRVEIVRLFNTYGPSDTNPHVLPEILRQLGEGTSVLKLGRTDTVRDYIYVEDVAEAMVRLAENGSETVSVTNIGTGTGLTVAQLVEAASSVSGKPVRVIQDPQRLRPVDRPSLIADASRLSTRTGLQPRSVLEGLRITWSNRPVIAPHS